MKLFEKVKQKECNDDLTVKTPVSIVKDANEVEKSDLSPSVILESIIKDLYNANRDGVVILNKLGCIISCNRAFREMVGYSESELLKMHYTELTRPLWEDLETEIIEEILEKKRESKEYEIEYIKKDGSLIHTSVTTWAIRDPNEDVIGMWALIRNITEHEESKKLLLEIQLRYQVLFEKACFSVAVLNSNGIILDCNLKIEEISGLKKAELKSKPLSFLLKTLKIENPSQLSEELLKEIRLSSKIEPKEIIARDFKNETWYFYIRGRLIEIYDKKFIQIIFQDITELKQTQLLLKEEKERIDLYIDSARVILVGLNMDGKITLLNSKGCEILGYDEGELLGKNWFETCLPYEDRVQMYNEFNKYIGKKHRKKGKYVYPIITKNGEIRQISWENAIISDKLGKISGVLYSGEDITARIKAEKDLVGSELKFRNLAEQSLMGIAILHNYKFDYVNKQFAKIFGYTPEEMTSWETLEYSKIIHPGDRELVLRREKNKLLGIPEISHYQFRGLTRTKEIKIIDNYSRGLAYKNGIGILTTIIDVTEKTQAGLKLKESEEKYKNLYDHFVDGIVLTDLKANILDCNEAFMNLTGYSLNELKSLTSRELVPSMWHENEHRIINEQVKERSISDEFEEEFVRKDGVIVPISVKMSLNYDSEGNPNGYSAYIRDITEKKKAEQIILKENERLMELEKMRQDFLTRITHELRTPLVSICGAADLIKEVYAGQYSEKVKSLIDVVERGGKRLRSLVDDLVDVSKIDNRALSMNLKDIDVTRLALEVIDDMIFFASERDIIINFDSEGICYAKVDELRFKQVISNILLNSIKYTLPHGTISVLIKDRGILVEFSISDTGIGFTESEKQILFKKFGKIERYGNGLNLNTEGSGLGLYISKKIVEMHNGRIWVESEGRNKGSTFIIQILK